MGTEVCRAVLAEPGMDLVAAVDPHHTGIDLRQMVGVPADGLVVSPDARSLADAGAEVAVDFTDAEAAAEHMQWCAGAGVHAVVGTTGLSAAEVEVARALFEASSANCLIAPNFAIGAVLMMRFAATASRYMEAAEIIELHHDTKLDSPSGTALLTAERMHERSRPAAAGPERPGVARVEVVAGARGAVGPSGIRVHSVRLPGLVAHHEVVLSAKGQSLVIRHDSFDRTSFMPGVLLGIRSIAGHRGLTLGLEKFIED